MSVQFDSNNNHFIAKLYPKPILEDNRMSQKDTIMSITYDRMKIKNRNNSGEKGSYTEKSKKSIETKNTSSISLVSA